MQVWTANTGSMVTVPDPTIESYYEQWDGYVPGNPSTDTGGVELDVLNDWQKQGFAGHALLAFADPKPANLVRDSPVDRALRRRLYRALAAADRADAGRVGCGAKTAAPRPRRAVGAATASLCPSTTPTALPASPGASRRP